PLPRERFVFADFSIARVPKDYHVVVDHHAYSVPYTLVSEILDVRLAANTVELFFKNKRVASHVRNSEIGAATTSKDHMPKSHLECLQWPASRLLLWGEDVGHSVQELVRAILDETSHHEKGSRSCLGILRLEKHYGGERLDKACARALRSGGRSYRHVLSILKNNLDVLPLDDNESEMPAIDHENVRGPNYYH
ncbi:MAG: transposase, partial [Deltaproteobacteria bacterium]|nr:transposase [Deltaproteobacteria bacterium]